MENEVKKHMRVNIRVPLEVKQWFEEEANNFGCPYSSLMAIALKGYIEQRESLASLKDLSSLVNDIEEIKNYLGKSSKTE